MRRLTREWVRKAEADYRLAGKVVRGSDPLHDHVCFLSQQCAEKHLKAQLEELGLTVPRTHALLHLLTLLLPHYPSLRSVRRGLKFLTRFAVGTRYPGENASNAQGARGVPLGRQGTRRRPPAAGYPAAAQATKLMETKPCDLTFACKAVRQPTGNA